MALLPGSPAIQAGSTVPWNNGFGISVNPPTTDQRGFPLDSRGIDIGAFQTQSSIVVNTTDDTVSGAEPSGELSLRNAINLADAPGGGTITFGIPKSDLGYDAGTGSFTIHAAAALPAITNGVSIDGTSEASYLGQTYTTPIIVISGAQAGSNVSGLHLTGSGSTIDGLVINQFSGDGIDITGSNDTIRGNYIGTDVTGTQRLGNLGNGITINGTSGNLIGGAAAGAGNIISGNYGDGILTHGGRGWDYNRGKPHRHGRLGDECPGQRSKRRRGPKQQQYHRRHDNCRTKCGFWKRLPRHQPGRCGP